MMIASCSAKRFYVLKLNAHNKEMENYQTSVEISLRAISFDATVHEAPLRVIMLRSHSNLPAFFILNIWAKVSSPRQPKIPAAAIPVICDPESPSWDPEGMLGDAGVGARAWGELEGASENGASVWWPASAKNQNGKTKKKRRLKE